MIAQGFSTAGGHEDEGVAAIDQVTDDVLLVSLEGVVAEEGFQFFVDG